MAEVTKAGYQLYAPEMIERIKQIHVLKEQRFMLHEIKNGQIIRRHWMGTEIIITRLELRVVLRLTYNKHIDDSEGSSSGH